MLEAQVFELQRYPRRQARVLRPHSRRDRTWRGHVAAPARRSVHCRNRPRRSARSNSGRPRSSAAGWSGQCSHDTFALGAESAPSRRPSLRSRPSSARASRRAPRLITAYRAVGEQAAVRSRRSIRRSRKWGIRVTMASARGRFSRHELIGHNNVGRVDLIRRQAASLRSRPAPPPCVRGSRRRFQAHRWSRRRH